MQSGDLDSAVKTFEAAIAQHPDSAELHYNLGLALKQRDDFAAAETELRRATTLDPRLPEAPFTLGVVLWQTGRASDAVAAFRDAIARRADYADAHYMLATVLKQEGDGAAALEEIRATIKYRPTSAEAYLSLGQLLTQRGDSAGAAAAFAEADRLQARKADDEASTFAVGVGTERARAGDLPGAIDQFRKAIRLAPDNPRAHFQLGLALQQSGAPGEARTHLDEAARLAPHLRLTTGASSAKR
jgi:protein O-GlcNAc transferase